MEQNGSNTSNKTTTERELTFDEWIAFLMSEASIANQLRKDVHALGNKISVLEKELDKTKRLHKRQMITIDNLMTEIENIEVALNKANSRQFKPNKGRKPTTVKKHREAVLKLLEQGKTQTEIAEILHISRNTVRAIKRGQ